MVKKLIYGITAFIMTASALSVFGCGKNNDATPAIEGVDV